MTKNTINILRKIYDGRTRGYTLYLDGSRTLPTKGNDSLLVFDDANEIVYSFRSAAKPYAKAQDVNILATEYAAIFHFDMDCSIEDTIKILNEFISNGLITEDEKKEFIKQIRSTDIDKGGYGELPPNKRVVQ